MTDDFFDDSPSQGGVPDHAPEKDVSTSSQKCPNCGNNLKFDPEKHKLCCEYCGSEFDIEEDKNYVEIDIAKGFETHEKWDNEVRVFRCENCGAKVILDKNATADVCPFCGTSHVVKIEEQAGIKPNVVIPFSISKEEAVKKVKTWAKKNLFAPRKFKKSLKTENLKGVYMPCYTFDSLTQSSYNGKIGIYHTRTVGSGKNRRTETWTEWRYIQGNYREFFNDVTISSVKNLTQKNLEKLGGFPETENRVYEDKFLYGFMAYNSERPITDCWSDAKDKMDAALKRNILSQYRYDVVGYLNVSTEHTGVTYKLELIPIWVGNFIFNKKPYNFFINGLNGKVTGKLPASPVRVSIAVLLGLGLLTGLFFLLWKMGVLEACMNEALAALPFIPGL